ncbi:MAG: hypothetical protein KDD73_06815 [Anaerolineales bacterium]|nr:hypothetical protein [Anaerolineales bacterium]MCB9128118.1 hypothetical protein [Ardenticatenales bacterium]MCB9171830.1 hypothetical protein [Ardenticatenales bacterium]
MSRLNSQVGASRPLLILVMLIWLVGCTSTPTNNQEGQNEPTEAGVAVASTAVPKSTTAPASTETAPVLPTATVTPTGLTTATPATTPSVNAGVSDDIADSVTISDIGFGQSDARLAYVIFFENQRPDLAFFRLFYQVDLLAEDQSVIESHTLSLPILLPGQCTAFTEESTTTGGAGGMNGSPRRCVHTVARVGGG